MEYMTPQEVMSQALRRQQQSQMLRGANTNAHQYDQLSSIMQMANNPGAAAAAKMSAESAQNQYKPVQMGQQGFALPASGEYASSPMYEDEQTSQRLLRKTLADQTVEARAQETQRRSDADISRDARDRELRGAEIQRKSDRDISEDSRKRDAVDANTTLKMSIAAMMAGRNSDAQQRAQDAADLRKEKFTNLQAQQQQKNVQQFGSVVHKNGLDSIADAVTSVNSMLEKPNLPGIGYGQKTLSGIPLVSDWTVGEEGKSNRSTVQKLVNAMMLTESGKAVTKSEEVRQALANMANDNYSAKDFRNAWEKTIRPALENVRANVHRSFDPSVIQDYVGNSGGGFDPRQSFIPKKADGGLSPSEQAELADLKKKLKKP